MENYQYVIIKLSVVAVAMFIWPHFYLGTLKWKVYHVVYGIIFKNSKRGYFLSQNA